MCVVSPQEKFGHTTHVKEEGKRSSYREIIFILIKHDYYIDCLKFLFNSFKFILFHVFFLVKKTESERRHDIINCHKGLQREFFLFRASPRKPFTHLDRKTPLKSCLFQKLHKTWYPWRYEEGELSIYDLCAYMPQKLLPQGMQLLIDSCLLSLSTCWLRVTFLLSI